MNKNVIFGCSLLICSAMVSAEVVPIKFENGINSIDINGDGFQDIVVKSIFDNNTSHPSTFFTLYIAPKDGQFYVVPSITENTYSLFDYAIAASGNRVLYYEFVRAKNKISLLSFEMMGDDLFGQTPVKITQYALQEEDEAPGVAKFRWIQKQGCQTKDVYESAELAVQSECYNSLINN